MRLSLIVALAFCGLLQESVSAQQTDGPDVVESVQSANPSPDGNAYLLSLTLKGGKRLSLEVPSAEAVKIVDGLSKPAGPGSQKRQVVALVQGISIQADSQGRFVLLQPRTSAGLTEPLAIPIEGADRFLQLFEEKAAEAKANATKKEQHK
jgi:hypothetical protein